MKTFIPGKIGLRSALLTALAFSFTQAAHSKTGADLVFDESLTMEKVMKKVEESDGKISNPRFKLVIDITKDCKTVTFNDGDRMVSEPVTLTSVETSKDCQVKGYAGQQLCFTYTRYHRANPKIVITAPRKMKPGETEVFETCLWNDTLTLRQVSTVYPYSSNLTGETFELTPPMKSAGGEAMRQNSRECDLMTENVNSCVYKCQDGSLVSEPNLLKHVNFDGRSSACPSTVPDPDLAP